ncbi:hypothetical protein [Paenibacillus sp. MBLB4367]|uniref:hypothetical protein n=1 Tax=Paenibacillus sp. MBLB4367 TaxID=3384767 RepID=UPI00390830A2
MAGLRNVLIFIAFSLLCGVLMSAFILVEGVFRYAFSLGAIVIGIKFFRMYASIGARIGFVALVVVFALILPAVYVTLAYAYDWPINPAYLEGVQQK